MLPKDNKFKTGLFAETIKEAVNEFLSDFHQFGKDFDLDILLTNHIQSNEWKNYFSEVEKEISGDFETNISFHFSEPFDFQSLSNGIETIKLKLEVKENNVHFCYYELSIEYQQEYYEREFDGDEILESDIYYSEKEPTAEIKITD